MRYILLFLVLMMFKTSVAQNKLSFPLLDTLGKSAKIDFSRYRGSKFLLVNIDAKDTSFRQYADLVALSARIQGCKVVVFPSENAPQTAAELFKVFSNNLKSANLIIVHPQVISGVNGNQVYKWLASKTSNGEASVICSKPFYKILISREGTLDAVFGPGMKVSDPYLLQVINK
jgi:glutathione peroxidase-family protein